MHAPAANQALDEVEAEPEAIITDVKVLYSYPAMVLILSGNKHLLQKTTFTTHNEPVILKH